MLLKKQLKLLKKKKNQKLRIGDYIMTITIDLHTILFILAIIGCVALIFLIKLIINLLSTVKNLNSVLDKVNIVLDDNTGNITKSISKLPKLVDDFGQVGENVRDVSEVVTDVAADIIVTKESVKGNFELLSEILTIVKSIFSSK